MNPNHTTIQINAASTGLLIGKAGATINNIKKQFGVKVTVPKKHEIQGSMANVTIEGNAEGVQGAAQHIQQLMAGASSGGAFNASGGGGGGFTGGGRGRGRGRGGRGRGRGAAQQGACQQVFETKPGMGHNAAITAVCIDGDHLYTAGKDGKVKVWEWDGTQLVQKHEQHTEGECHALLSYSGWLFCGVNGGVQAWNLPNGTGPIPMEHPGCVTAICAHGAHIFTGAQTPGSPSSIRIWTPDETGGGFKGIHEIPGHSAQIRRLATAMNGTILLSCGHDNSARLYNMADPTQVQVLSDHSEQFVMDITEMTMDSAPFVCTAGLDNTIKVYKVGDAGAEGVHAQTCSSKVTQLCPTADPQGQPILAAALTDGKVVLFKTPSFEIVAELEGHPQLDEVVALAQVAGTLVVSGSADGVLRVFVWNQ